jgi:hypothetical protein
MIEEHALVNQCLEELNVILEEKSETIKLLDVEDLPTEFRKPLTPENY